MKNLLKFSATFSLSKHISLFIFSPMLFDLDVDLEDVPRDFKVCHSCLACFCFLKFCFQNIPF